MQRIRSGKADRNFGDSRTSGVTSGRGGAAVRAGRVGIVRLILARCFGATADFAQGCVVAHGFGHHVQCELGISAWTRQQQQANQSQKNACRAGSSFTPSVWPVSGHFLPNSVVCWTVATPKSVTSLRRS